MVNLLQLDRVDFIADEKKIVEDINLSFTEKERTSIEGGSGSGKSTLLKLMAGLNPCSNGRVYYKNKDINDLDYASYRKEVSYVYQNPHLFGQTVEDNLAFPAKIRHEEFDFKQAQDFMAELALDYIPLDKDIDSLSGGEKQRIALIRHFIYPPQMLLLDEITASLDEDSSKQIWSWIEDQAQKHHISLVWISHKSNEQALAKRNIRIEKGKIIEDTQEGGR